ncbi:putative AP-3 adaptor complex subunit APL5/AP-3 complex subunit delta [Arthroderma uncinatum]|uniref:putative AP-3 adaptor complex subunit APL5/AP-3 complex subunit delta n=1 Tax=Arthroderma uncinatum TaxID=74035 RepID=UPI00144ABF86|nr:putative AP-3 adaptor complex subunit APL5/AP-3 complex subunit delta [Arthroderma uncinatum]KAF3481730.1 putative AP-3 adaptor complex subunit APL5/AP-3 complex subunit delta [Arthroderma uncinatum]
MDKKATSLLKLIYLEMFGYDMSWASFHVLEVMSSPKFHQKRVGYLGAVQSFRVDTEVLMLATNLLKKVGQDIKYITDYTALALTSIIGYRVSAGSYDVPTSRDTSAYNFALPCAITAYRPYTPFDAFTPGAWPKIKERLMDTEEDGSVTAAVINVVCELGWRRPQDFLPLAPRLFELLVDGGNNWMAIKIIKLFASLTPLEPRLVRKLIRPLTNIMHTTSAMSLLYECINGVIQGGILDGVEGIREGEAIAQLCVDKLRGMLVLEEDPNLKYVALLAFNRIVTTHPMLVSAHQDVIMGCLDDNDISIRLQALELVSGMVASDSLQSVVNHLITQLQTASAVTDGPTATTSLLAHITPSADYDDDDPEAHLELARQSRMSAPSLPNEYRLEVLHRILDICSRDTYSNLTDFEWYVDVLVQLVRLIPPASASKTNDEHSSKDAHNLRADISNRIGTELRNVAVRVKSVRPEAARAAETLVLIDNRATLFPSSGTSSTNLLEPVAWIVGEYAEYLNFPDQSLSSLIHSSNLTLSPTVLAGYIQAIPKIFVHLTSQFYDWNVSRQGEVSLLLARITDFLEKLSSHPELDVQERAIEFLELLRLTKEAVSASDIESGSVPLLVSSAIPSLFTGLDLNPVAVGAQKKVPIPSDLDLDQPINPRYVHIQRESSNGWFDSFNHDECYQFYHIPDSTGFVTKPQKEVLSPTPVQPTSYQNVSEGLLSEPLDITARKRAARRERNKDDPFYIGQGQADEESSDPATPFNQALRGANNEDLDLDSIPIIDLAIDQRSSDKPDALKARKPKRKLKPKKVEIIGDETLEFDNPVTSPSMKPDSVSAVTRAKRSLLEVDSSGIGQLSLEEESGLTPNIGDLARKEAEDAEMVKAMAEIQRLRLEMQREAERIHGSQEVPAEGTMIKRKKKKKVVSSKKSKSSTQETDGQPSQSQDVAVGEEGEAPVVKKKKKKKVTTSKKTAPTQVEGEE